MKTIGCVMLLIVLISTLALVSGADSPESKGAVWLGARGTAPPEVNVSGVWHSKDWGRLNLKQVEGSREVTGSSDGWEIIGVVSGKKLSLIFCQVVYSAELNLESDNNLMGGYASSLITPKSKTTPMVMTK